MKKILVASTNKKVIDAVKNACDKYSSYFDPAFFSDTDEALGFIDYELPEIKVLDANQLGYTVRPVKDKEGNIIQASTSDLADYVCQVVTVENLYLRSTDDIRLSNDGEYYTVKMYNSKGDVFDVFFGNSLISKWKVEEIFKPGKRYSITGGIAYYMYANGYYQIAVGDAPRYSNGELHPEDVIRVNDIKEMQ